MLDLDIHNTRVPNSDSICTIINIDISCITYTIQYVVLYTVLYTLHALYSAYTYPSTYH